MKIGKKDKIAMFAAIGLALVGGGIVLYKFINRNKNADATDTTKGQSGATSITSGAKTEVGQVKETAIINHVGKTSQQIVAEIKQNQAQGKTTDVSNIPIETKNQIAKDTGVILAGVGKG